MYVSSVLANASISVSFKLDINKCLPNGGRGPCAQNCTNTIGSFYCSCNSGYSLSGYACNGKFLIAFVNRKDDYGEICKGLLFEISLDINIAICKCTILMQ